VATSDASARVGHVDALAFRKRAAGNDSRCREVGPAGLDAQPNLAVVDQQVGVGLQGREDLRMRQAHASLVAWRGIEVQTEGGARLQPDRAGGEGADTQLRPLQVEQHADRPAGLALHLADEVQPLAMLGVGTVAEVQAEHIRTGIEQRADGGEIRAGRAERGDDLGVAEAAHGDVERFSAPIKDRARPTRGSRRRPASRYL
jgi:hypothetical protein